MNKKRMCGKAGAVGGALLLLAGCHPSHPVTPAEPKPGSPFEETARPAQCEVSPVVTDPVTGRQTATLTVTSDQGHCGLPLDQEKGGSYAAFGVAPSPAHGRSFIYNFGNRTNVTYQPLPGYSGKDVFGVTLIAGPGEPRHYLTVNVEVHKAAVPVQTGPQDAPSGQVSPE